MYCKAPAAWTWIENLYAVFSPPLLALSVAEIFQEGNPAHCKKFGNGARILQKQWEPRRKLKFMVFDGRLKLPVMASCGVSGANRRIGTHGSR